MKIKPLANNILIRPEENKRTSESIIIPDSNTKETPERGEVLAIGAEVEDIKVGDRVIFIKYSPNEITMEGEEFLIIKEEDIIATI